MLTRQPAALRPARSRRRRHGSSSAAPTARPLELSLEAPGGAVRRAHRGQGRASHAPKETVMLELAPHSATLSRSTASRRCPRRSAARPVPACRPQSAAQALYAWPLWARADQRPRRAGLARLAAARRAAAPARRAPAPSGCGPASRPAAIGASPSWGAPGPTCVTSWSAASRASSRSARPGSTPTTRPSRRQLSWPNGVVAKLYSAEEPDRCAAPNTTPPGATSAPAGAARRASHNAHARPAQSGATRAAW